METGGVWAVGEERSFRQQATHLEELGFREGCSTQEEVVCGLVNAVWDFRFSLFPFILSNSKRETPIEGTVSFSGLFYDSWKFQK